MEVAHSERYKREEDLCHINILLMACTCHASEKLSIDRMIKLKLTLINMGNEFISALFAVGTTALRGRLRKVRSKLVLSDKAFIFNSRYIVLYVLEAGLWK